jgi:DDE superfamily endonuclease
VAVTLALADVFGAEMAAEVWDRFTVHYTPTHGSWLYQAEIEIGILSRQCLGKRCIPSLQTLRTEAKARNRRMNRAGVKISWKFDRKVPAPFQRKTFHAVKT